MTTDSHGHIPRFASDVSLCQDISMSTAGPGPIWSINRFGADVQPRTRSRHTRDHARGSLPTHHLTNERFMNSRHLAARRRALGWPLAEVEARLEEMTAVLTAGPTEFLTARNRIAGAPRLHSLMAFESLNAVDGRRTGLDVRRHVAAEAPEAGQFYYGTVDAGMVQEYLRNAEAAAVIELRAATDR